MGFYTRFLKSSADDLKDPQFYRALIGELIGVLFLVFVACSSPYGDKDLDNTRVSLCFGLSVATMVWLLANVSGGHINPAVTSGMFITRKISLIKFILYILFQCIGGILGALIQKGLTCNWQVSYAATELKAVNYTCGLGMTALGPEVTAGQGFAIELLITFVLVITVFATCDGSRNDLNGSGPLAIGLSVTMCHLGFIRLTGASMNTARTFGPAVVLGAWENHWVYWIGPIAGGILAGLLYEFIFAGNACPAKLVSWLKDSDYEQPEEEESSSYEMKNGRRNGES